MKLKLRFGRARELPGGDVEKPKVQQLFVAFGDRGADDGWIERSGFEWDLRKSGRTTAGVDAELRPWVRFPTTASDARVSVILSHKYENKSVIEKILLDGDVSPRALVSIVVFALGWIFLLNPFPSSSEND